MILAMKAVARTQSPSSSGQTFVIGVAVILLIITFIMASKISPLIFSFHFNAYALLSLLALISDLVIFILISSTGAKTDDLYWLGTNFAVMTFWALMEVFCRLGATSATAAFWYPLSSMFTYFAPATFFMFALSYTHPARSRHVGTIVILIVTTFGLSFLDLTTHLFNHYNVIISSPWGGDVAPGPLYNILTVWLLALYFTSIAMLAHLSFRTINPRLRRQSLIFLIAAVIPVTFGIFTDAILPALGVQVLPMAALFTALSGVLITYGALRYRLLDLTPAVIATNILDTMNEAVIGIASDFSIHYANQGAEHMLGYTSEQISKLHFFQFLSAEWTDSRLREDLLAPLTTKPVVELDDIDFRTASGIFLTAKVSISQVNSGDPGDGYIIVMTDVSELKESYDALEHEKANVEHTVEVRTKELRVAQDRLVETDKLKTEFVRLTSHNLRTPLAIVSGNLEMLRMPQLSDTQRASFLKGAEAGSQQLRTLVEDLLTINNIEAGDKLERESVLVSSILGPPIAEVARLASTRNNTFVTNLQTGEARLSANASRLRAAITNILDNAIKYTSNGHITLDAVIENNCLQIVVKDNGIGIEPSEIQKLFTKFHRGTDTLNYSYEGEGIGLYLTKLIIEDHGGTIQLDSMPCAPKAENAPNLANLSDDCGTTVTVRLPLIV